MVVRRKKARRKAPMGRGLSAKQKREVKGLITRDIETKHEDTITGAIGVPSGTGVLSTQLFTVAQGTNEDQRIGGEIKYKSLNMRCVITGADATNTVRFIVFQWKPDNNVEIPTAASILADTVTAPWLSNLNNDSFELGKFHILHDKLYSFTTASSAPKNFNITWYGRKLGRKIQRFSTTGIVGTNNFYVLAVSDSIAASHPTIQYTARLEFTDA